MSRSGGSFGGLSAGLITEVPGLSHLWVRPPSSPTPWWTVFTSCPGRGRLSVHGSLLVELTGFMTVTLLRLVGDGATARVVVVDA